MKKKIFYSFLAMLVTLTAVDLEAIGGRGGGGRSGGGRGGRSMSRTPSMSRSRSFSHQRRPSHSRPSRSPSRARPKPRPKPRPASRPGRQLGPTTRPAPMPNFPGHTPGRPTTHPGRRPVTREKVTREKVTRRQAKGQLKRPTLPATPQARDRFNNRENRRQGIGDSVRDRITDRDDLLGNINDRIQDNRYDFWDDRDFWKIPAWGALNRWGRWRFDDPYYYDYGYGGNIWADDGTIYIDDNPAYSTEEYAEQAEEIVQEATPPSTSKEEWKPLGLFAIAQDETDTTDPSMYLQLAVTKDGYLGGYIYNSINDSTNYVEGSVDEESQRAAFAVEGKSRPIMETGIYNLTKDQTPALVHFEDGTTQQMLLVRLDDQA